MHCVKSIIYPQDGNKMEKAINLEVRLTKKTLAVNGKKLSLDNSLLSAEVSRIQSRKDERELTLQYMGKKGTTPYHEIMNIYSLIKEQRLSERIEVSSCKYNPPNVSLVGKINATIYS